MTTEMNGFARLPYLARQARALIVRDEDGDAECRWVSSEARREPRSA